MLNLIPAIGQSKLVQHHDDALDRFRRRHNQDTADQRVGQHQVLYLVESHLPLSQRRIGEGPPCHVSDQLILELTILPEHEREPQRTDLHEVRGVALAIVTLGQSCRVDGQFLGLGRCNPVLQSQIIGRDG